MDFVELLAEIPAQTEHHDLRIHRWKPDEVPFQSRILVNEYIRVCLLHRGTRVGKRRRRRHLEWTERMRNPQRSWLLELVIVFLGPIVYV